MIQNTDRKLQEYLPWISLAVLSAAVFAAYYPGLSGPFLLDDWNTLPKLGAYGAVDNVRTFISYVTSGTAGPSGRPLALASFLIDARNWPANPWPFKLTNVLLHLLNGGMLAWLLKELGRARGLAPRKAAWAAVLGAGAWLAHPLMVSTTLYVVQRMAMLAAFFVFAGLACYVGGRLRLASGRKRSGYALMIAGLVGGTALGFLSKENAALLPLLAWVLEITVLRGLEDTAPAALPPEPAGHAFPVSGKRPHPVFQAVFLWVPSLFIVGYLLWQLRDVSALAPARDFTIGTRLLTEARILVQYIYYLIIPHAQTHGLYAAIPLSRNVFHPWTTLPAICLIILLLAGALAMRRRWPAVAAAVLFFFAGHLLESTTLPLELYYEHRNYLPAALAFWPLGLWWVTGSHKLRLRYSTIAAVFIVLLTLTALRATLWGNAERLALTWMEQNPNSVRATIVGTDTLEALGKKQIAYGRLYMASKQHPANISIALARVGAACALRGATPGDIEALEFAARHDWNRLSLLYDTLSARLDNPGSCPGFGPATMFHVVENARKNPHAQGEKSINQKLDILYGRLYLAAHQPGRAYGMFEKALNLEPTPDATLTMGAYLLGAGLPAKTIELLDAYSRLPHYSPPYWTMPGVHRLWLAHIGWYRESFQAMRESARQALAESKATPGRGW